MAVDYWDWKNYSNQYTSFRSALNAFDPTLLETDDILKAACLQIDMMELVIDARIMKLHDESED